MDADVSFSIGLGYLDREGLVPDNLNNKLICKHNKWELATIHRNGDLVIDWNIKTILFTNNEPYRMHRHFFIQVRTNSTIL